MSISLNTHCGVPSITVHRALPSRSLILTGLYLEVMLIGLAAAAPGGMHAILAAALLCLGAIILIRAAASRPDADGPGPADVVTGMRLAIAIGVAAMAIFGEPSGFLLTMLLLATATTDWVDGWIARKTTTCSRFGARFDMETDTALLAATALAAMDFTGPAVLLAPLLRPLWIVFGRLLPWLERPLPPSLRRKTFCAVPIILLVMVPWPLGETTLAAPVATVAVALLLTSFALDLIHQWQRHRHLASIS